MDERCSPHARAAAAPRLLTYAERPGGVYLYLAARGPRYLYLVLFTRSYLHTLR